MIIIIAMSLFQYFTCRIIQSFETVVTLFATNLEPGTTINQTIPGQIIFAVENVCH